MSARSDATTDQCRFSGTIPNTSGGFSFTGWARVHTDQNNNQTLFRISLANGTRINFATDTDGTSGPACFTTGGSVVNSLGFVVDAWRKIAMTCDGDDAIVYARDPTTGGTVSASGTIGGAGTGNADVLSLFGRGPSDASEWYAGDLAYIRFWFGTRLTQTQVEAEWDSSTPIVTTNLFAHWKLLTATDLNDYSGNGNHLTAGSTSLTTVDDPPIPITGNGSASVSNATVAGTGTVPVGGTGSVTAGNTTLSGTGSTPTTGSGGVTSLNATVSGTGNVAINGNGSVSAGSAQVSGTGTLEVTGSGGVTAGNADIDGTGSADITGTGSVIASNAMVAGTGSSLPVIGGSGSLIATSSIVAGLGTVLIIGNGSLAPPPAVVSGQESFHEIPSAKRSVTTVLVDRATTAVKKNRVTTTMVPGEL